MNEALIKELFGFVITKASLPKKTVLNLESRVYEDLDITGDDAIELILAYSKRFGVDISGFEASTYFSGESAFWSTGNKKTLTLKHLLKGIEHSVLNEDIILGQI